MPFTMYRSLAILYGTEYASGTLHDILLEKSIVTRGPPSDNNAFFASVSYYSLLKYSLAN